MAVLVTSGASAMVSTFSKGLMMAKKRSKKGSSRGAKRPGFPAVAPGVTVVRTGIVVDRGTLEKAKLAAVKAKLPVGEVLGLWAAAHAAADGGDVSG